MPLRQSRSHKSPVFMELCRYEKRPMAIAIGRGEKQSDGAVSRFPDFFTTYCQAKEKGSKSSPKTCGERFSYLK